MQPIIWIEIYKYSMSWRKIFSFTQNISSVCYADQKKRMCSYFPIYVTIIIWSMKTNLESSAQNFIHIGFLRAISLVCKSMFSKTGNELSNKII